MGVSILYRQLEQRGKSRTKAKTSLYLDITHNGRRWKESLKLILVEGDVVGNKEKERLAKVRRAEKELELNNQRFGYVSEANKNKNFIEFFEEVVKTKDVQGHNWHSTAVHLRSFAGDNLPFKKIDEIWLEQFKRFLLDSFTQNSAHTYFSKIKAALRLAVKQKLVTVNPAEFVDQVSRVEVPRTYLLFEEVQRLAAAASPNPDLKRAFLFACASGLRISDIRAVRWRNLVGTRLEFQQKKTGKFEYLPLTKSAIELLGDPGPADQHIFKVPFDHQIARDLRKWCAAAGIDKHVTFHTSRHTYATVMLTSGADLPTIQSMLGHRSIRTTQIYAQIVDSKKQDAADLFPTINFQE